MLAAQGALVQQRAGRPPSLWCCSSLAQAQLKRMLAAAIAAESCSSRLLLRPQRWCRRPRQRPLSLLCQLARHPATPFCQLSLPPHRRPRPACLGRWPRRWTPSWRQ